MTFDEVISQAESEEWAILCPFHLEKTPSCFINTKKQQFYCFGCGTGGSFVKLKVLLDGISYEEAKQQLYKGEVPNYLISDFNNLGKESRDAIYYKSTLTAYKEAGEIRERGITKNSSQLYNIRRDISENLYIPYFDSDENLRGLQVRLENPTKKRYNQVLRFRRSEWLFGENLKQEKLLILTEGALDAVKLHSVLNHPVMSFNGSTLTSQQRSKIGKMPIKMILLWQDNDPAGIDSMLHNYWDLRDMVSGEVYCVRYTTMDKDPCDLSRGLVQFMFDNMVWVPKWRHG